MSEIDRLYSEMLEKDVQGMKAHLRASQRMHILTGLTWRIIVESDMAEMQKIIDAQGPAGCRTDLGTLTADIAAASDGIVSAIDCLRLNRLARTAGAPIDKGAGISIFKKIGDRVEKGEPLYRIHSFDRSEYDLAVAAAKTDAGYAIDGHSAPARTAS